LLEKTFFAQPAAAFTPDHQLPTGRAA
jgi:hypothetical protein